MGDTRISVPVPEALKRSVSQRALCVVNVALSFAAADSMSCSLCS
jgi:hypothetical protein